MHHQQPGASCGLSSRPPTQLLLYHRHRPIAHGAPVGHGDRVKQHARPRPITPRPDPHARQLARCRTRLQARVASSSAGHVMRRSRGHGGRHSARRRRHSRSSSGPACPRRAASTCGLRTRAAGSWARHPHCLAPPALPCGTAYACTGGMPRNAAAAAVATAAAATATATAAAAVAVSAAAAAVSSGWQAGQCAWARALCRHGHGRPGASPPAAGLTRCRAVGGAMPGVPQTTTSRPGPLEASRPLPPSPGMVGPLPRPDMGRAPCAAAGCVEIGAACR
jgi:hypothetical protein